MKLFFPYLNLENYKFCIILLLPLAGEWFTGENLGNALWGGVANILPCGFLPELRGCDAGATEWSVASYWSRPPNNQLNHQHFTNVHWPTLRVLKHSYILDMFLVFIWSEKLVSSLYEIAKWCANIYWWQNMFNSISTPLNHVKIYRNKASSREYANII